MTAAASTRSPPPLFLLGALVALSYLAGDFIDTPQPWAPIWKASGIVLLGVYALSRGAWAAGAGLLLSSLGDVMLALKPAQMIAGMAGFGAAHLAYIAAFARFFDLRRVDAPRALLAGLILAVSAALLFWLLPDMGGLTGPGLGYQAIITAMVTLAMLSHAPMATRAGAVIFMMSDSLIALGLYKHIATPPGSVWITYAIAQILLAWGFALARAERA